MKARQRNIFISTPKFGHRSIHTIRMRASSNSCGPEGTSPQISHLDVMFPRNRINEFPHILCRGITELLILRSARFMRLASAIITLLQSRFPAIAPVLPDMFALFTEIWLTPSRLPLLTLDSSEGLRSRYVVNAPLSRLLSHSGSRAPPPSIQVDPPHSSESPFTDCRVFMWLLLTSLL
jgi:hypothetical protein